MAEIKGVISEMTSKQIILKSKSKRNFISLSKKRQSIKDKVKPGTDTVAKQNYYDELYLFNSLREARKKAADRFMQSGYLICSDRILKDVARLKPKNKIELLSISGFNNRMFNKLGNDFLEVIANYNPKSVSTVHQKIKSELPPNIIETKKLLDKKYTLKEIAETRKLTEAVVSMQIESIIEFEPETDITHLFSKDIYEQILSEAEKGFENIKDLKERLPSKITYPQIRIALAKQKTNNPFHS
jgi:ATP-dependent DNA helicase RecQ